MLGTRRRGGANIACEHSLGRQPLHLYGYLWAKPEFISDEKSGSFSFVLPDTVLFKQQKPIKWFFTSKQERGKILVKSKKNLSTTTVLQAFLEPKGETPEGCARETHVVATFLYLDRAHNGDPVMVVEHLTTQTLHHLLTNREKPSMSVLQRYIPTRSGYNHLIQSVFTPDSCIVRKCVNSNLLSDTSVCLAQRTATFEADEQHVKPREVTNRELREAIEHTHLEMSNHFVKLIGKPISRNVAYFKIGWDNRIYLLWCSMLSFESGSTAFAKNLRLSLSHQDRLQHLVATTTAVPSVLEKSVTTSSTAQYRVKACPGCGVLLPRELVDFYATFKAIIKAFEIENRDPLAQDGTAIPPVLEKVLSPITDERFKELSTDMSFLYRTIALCQMCAHRINTARQTRDVSPAPTKTAKTVPDRELPIYMQTAHSIFWGRVARLEAEHAQKSEARLPRPRPISAASSSPSARLEQRSIPAAGLTTASWRRILPQLVPTEASHAPKHCMHKLAEHLQRAFGGPSVRLALSRANIFPPTSTVTLDMLEWICEPKLLADVFSYWTEFCRSSGSGWSGTSLDLDALDAILSVCVDSSRKMATDAATTKSHPARADTREGGGTRESCTTVARSAPLLHPVRPSTTKGNNRTSLIHRPTPRARTMTKPVCEPESSPPVFVHVSTPPTAAICREHVPPVDASQHDSGLLPQQIEGCSSALCRAAGCVQAPEESSTRGGLSRGDRHVASSVSLTADELHVLHETLRTLP